MPPPRARRCRARRHPARLALLAAGLALLGAGCAPSGPPDRPAMAPGQVLTYDPSGHTALVTMIAGYNRAGAGFNFDGYANGRLTLTVPAGWTVAVDCENQGEVNHSCAVVADRADINAGPPIFPGASTPDPATGMAKGQKATFRFVVPDRPGVYRLACIVPGHDLEGMWARFVVTSGGVPAVTTAAGGPATTLG